jgi:hypothetical protein
LTRILVPLAGRAIAVEPDPEMRAQLMASVPGAVALPALTAIKPSPRSSPHRELDATAIGGRRAPAI